jgi:hypothetical protein
MGLVECMFFYSKRKNPKDEYASWRSVLELKHFDTMIVCVIDVIDAGGTAAAQHLGIVHCSL